MPKDDLYTHTFFGWIRTIALGIGTFVVTCYVTYKVALWVDRRSQTASTTAGTNTSIW